MDGLTANYDNTDINSIKKYAGSYGKTQVKLKDDKLYYQFEDRPAILLIPISDDYFLAEGVDYFRIKFITNGDMIIMKQIFTYGSEREYSKDE